MNKDLVRRLREDTPAVLPAGFATIIEEAATEIASLRERVRVLEGALRKIYEIDAHRATNRVALDALNYGSGSLVPNASGG